MTVQQIADVTRVMSSIIEDLEREDFSRIAAPIYGRGFVKLYCEAVGLDAKPMIAEFMEIYNGNRDLGIRERPVAGEPANDEPTAAATETAPTPEPAPVELPPEPPPEPPPVARPIPETPTSAIQPGLFDPPAPEPPVAPPPEPQTAPIATDEPVYSRYATPLRNAEIDNRSWARGSSPFGFIPASFWRWSLVAVVAAALIALTVVGLRALYHATASIAMPEAKTELEPSAPAPAAVNPPAQPPATQAAPRTPQEIPPLYMD